MSILDAFRRAPKLEKSVRNTLGRMRADLVNDIAQTQASAGVGTLDVPRVDTRWRGASQTLRSLSRWFPVLGSGRSDTPKPERDRLAARSYDAYRNHMLGRAVIGRLRTNIVGTGLTFHPGVDARVLGISDEVAEELNSEISSQWGTYFNNPLEVDFEASSDGAGLQNLGLVNALLGGDCFALTPFKERPAGAWGLKVQLIDGARVSNVNDAPDTPTLQDGVEVSVDGEPIAIHVRNTHPGDRTFTSVTPSWERREFFGIDSGRRRIFQIWNDRDRIGATRGVPLLAPILEPLQTLEQYSRAELMAAVVSALFTVFIEKESAQVDARGEPLPAIAGQTVKQDAGPQGPALDLVLGPAAVLDLAPGEKASFADPARPSAKFDPFFIAMVKQMGASIELPLDELLLHYSSSYSAARAAMLQAWRMYTMRRVWLVQQFLQPLFELWFDEAVARGRLKVTDYADPRRRAAYTRGVWIGPARGAMDEGQEADAAVKRINGGLSNEAVEIAQMHGEPRDVIYRQRQREIKQRERDGMLLGPAPGQAAAPAPAPGAKPDPAAPTDPRAPGRQLPQKPPAADPAPEDEPDPDEIEE